MHAYTHRWIEVFQSSSNRIADLVGEERDIVVIEALPTAATSQILLASLDLLVGSHGECRTTNGFIAMLDREFLNT